MWSYGGQSTIGPRVPFVVDMSKSTFEYLDELLREVCEGMDGQSDWPPPQEKECMAVAGLNLLNLQVGLQLTVQPPYNVISEYINVGIIMNRILMRLNNTS